MDPVQPKIPFYKKYLTRKKVLPFLVLLSFLVLILVVYFAKKNAPTTTVPTPTSAPTALDLETKNWDTLEKNNFSLKYPKGVEVQEKTDKTELRFTGPNQSNSPELIDGLKLEFYFKDFEKNQTLTSLVQSELKKISSSPLEKITQNSQKIQIASLHGFSFVTQGMVRTKYYYLQLNDSQYLLIIDSSQSSPSGQDFESIVKTILSTIEVNNS